jgi:hypothetical protein
MSSSPRLLRDLIHIPTSVFKGDLVYQLVDAADNAAKTVSQYGIPRRSQDPSLCRGRWLF